MSGDYGQIAPAWVQALNELEDMHRDNVADMGSYSYRYADLASVCQQARKVLAEHDLAVHQTASASQPGTVEVVTTVWHTSGEHITAPALTFPAKGGPQDIGSAITYARRYALMAFLGLATDDDDGAAAQAAARQADEPHPLSDRVTALIADMKKLSDDGRGELKTWADGRSLSPKAMINDEAWLELVESWVDEALS